MNIIIPECITNKEDPELWDDLLVSYEENCCVDLINCRTGDILIRLCDLQNIEAVFGTIISLQRQKAAASST